MVLQLGELTRLYLSADRRSAVVSVVLGVNPVSPEGQAWLKRFRVRLEQESAARGLQLDMAGLGSVNMDSFDLVYACCPYIACSISAVILVIVGLCFHSVVSVTLPDSLLLFKSLFISPLCAG